VGDSYQLRTELAKTVNCEGFSRGIVGGRLTSDELEGLGLALVVGHFGGY